MRGMPQVSPLLRGLGMRDQGTTQIKSHPPIAMPLASAPSPPPKISSPSGKTPTPTSPSSNNPTPSTPSCSSCFDDAAEDTPESSPDRSRQLKLTGLSRSMRSLFAHSKHFECNRDFSPITWAATVTIACPRRSVPVPQETKHRGRLVELHPQGNSEPVVRLRPPEIRFRNCRD